MILQLTERAAWHHVLGKILTRAFRGRDNEMEAQYTAKSLIKMAEGLSARALELKEKARATMREAEEQEFRAKALRTAAETLMEGIPETVDQPGNVAEDHSEDSQEPTSERPQSSLESTSTVAEVLEQIRRECAGKTLSKKELLQRARELGIKSDMTMVNFGVHLSRRDGFTSAGKGMWSIDNRAQQLSKLARAALGRDGSQGGLQ